MARPKPNKSELLSALTQYVLNNGLSQATLRPLAKAANTSDRLLIYHFTNKENLISELLIHISEDFADKLSSQIPTQTLYSEEILIKNIIIMIRTENFRPYIRIWLEIIAGAGQQRPGFLKAGKSIADIFMNWISQRHKDGMDIAPKIFALIEGLITLDALGRSDIVDKIISEL